MSGPFGCPRWDFFSAAQWIVAPQRAVVDLVQALALEPLETCLLVEADAGNPHRFGSEEHLRWVTGRMSASAPVAGFQLLCGESIQARAAEYCSALSRIDDVWRFGIDIWTPEYSFALFRSGKLVRRYEYWLEDGEDHEEADGDRLPVEDAELELPHPPHGYDNFYWPLALMDHLGIDSNALDDCLARDCVVYRV